METQRKRVPRIHSDPLRVCSAPPVERGTQAMRKSKAHFSSSDMREICWTSSTQFNLFHDSSSVMMLFVFVVLNSSIIAMFTFRGVCLEITEVMVACCHRSLLTVISTLMIRVDHNGKALHDRTVDPNPHTLCRKGTKTKRNRQHHQRHDICTCTRRGA